MGPKGHSPVSKIPDRPSPPDGKSQTARPNRECEGRTGRAFEYFAGHNGRQDSSCRSLEGSAIMERYLDALRKAGLTEEA